MISPTQQESVAQRSKIRSVDRYFNSAQCTIVIMLTQSTRGMYNAVRVYVGRSFSSDDCSDMQVTDGGAIFSSELPQARQQFLHMLLCRGAM